MRDSKEGYRVVRILRNAKRPLTAREVCERMGRDPTDSKDYNAVRRLLQRHAMAGNIARDGHGHYAEAVEIEKPKPIIVTAWDDSSHQTGTIKLDFGITQRGAYLPKAGQEEKDVHEELWRMTNPYAPGGDQEWERLVTKEVNKQRGKSNGLVGRRKEK
jgi:hypothetical protein